MQYNKDTEMRKTKPVSYQLNLMAGHMRALRLCEFKQTMDEGLKYLEDWLLELAEITEP
jgi:hypothetical protein